MNSFGGYINMDRINPRLVIDGSKEISWWVAFTHVWQQRLIDKHFVARKFNSMTNDEIKEIYKKEKAQDEAIKLKKETAALIEQNNKLAAENEALRAKLNRYIDKSF